MSYAQGRVGNDFGPYVFVIRISVKLVEAVMSHTI